MSNKSCFHEFSVAMALRLTSPLPSGVYKLRNFYNNMQEMKDEVRRIGAYKNGVLPSGALWCCLPHEVAKWLKNVPLIAAWGLGYDFLPAFAALPLDGVDENLVRRESPRLRTRVNELLCNLEATHIKLNSGVKIEYQAMRRGSSLLEPLLDDTLAILPHSVRGPSITPSVEPDHGG